MRRLIFFIGLLLIVVAIVVVSTAAYSKEQQVVSTLPGVVQSRLQTHSGRYVPLAQIPEPLQLAVVDTEDHSFYANPGVSLEGILRSILVDFSSGSYLEGGSTITQQLAKNQFVGDERTASRKLREIILALVITRSYSKQEILELYLNSVYFGHGAWGVQTAARVYFNLPVAALNYGQCTLLAGLLQSPNAYDPLVNYQVARARQSQVLQSMVHAGTLDQGQTASIYALPLNLRGRSERSDLP